jgi:predicted NBD/HSP70 family sugar kinase
VFDFNKQAGVVLVGDLGQTGCHLAACDLAGRPLAEHTAPLSIAEGPAAVLGWLRDQFAELLTSIDRPRSDVKGIGIGVPGPVDFATGRPISPPAMPGWDGEDIPAHLADFAECPVLVDNDVRIMALGEHRAARPDDAHMLFVKIGSGIGAGVLVDGKVVRGDRGAAGDIGHVVVSPDATETCACGNVGCLNAVASGWAVAGRLGSDAPTPPDVVRLVKQGHADAIREVRRTGRLAGRAIAGAVNLLNPSSVVIGGTLAQAHEQVFAAVREVIYSEATPLASRHLDIALSELGHEAGIIGAAHMVVDHVFEPHRIDQALAG